VSYVLTLVHSVINIGPKSWMPWPPTLMAIGVMSSIPLYLALFYFLSKGHYWARLVYAVVLGVRTVNFLRYPLRDWQGTEGLLLMTVVSFLCQYIAMYWLFTKPGRRWFVTSTAPEL
jgi:hypothetical protein